jgi:hypothetical protein
MHPGQGKIHERKSQPFGGSDYPPYGRYCGYFLHIYSRYYMGILWSLLWVCFCIHMSLLYGYFMAVIVFIFL